MLLKDTRTHELFSLKPDYNEEEQKFFDEIRMKKLKGIALSTEERIKDLER